MEPWKDVLAIVFGSKSRKRWRTVAMDIMLVDKGIKRAYLFDQWSSSKDELNLLLLNLQRQQLIHSRLGILIVGWDVLLFSVLSFQGSVLFEMPHVVNVSPSLDQPILMDAMKSKVYLATWQEFRQFQEFVSQINSSEGLEISPFIPSYEIRVSQSINPPCLFGLVLDYAFVYWYDRDEEEGNCLSMQPLRHYEVKGSLRTDSGKAQRSCQPHDLSKEQNHNDFVLSPEQSQKMDDLPASQDIASHQIVDEFSSKTGEDSIRINQIHSGSEHPSNFSCTNKNHAYSPHFATDCHQIFSFTIPECIYSMATKIHVDKWFAIWQSSIPWSSIFSNVWMEEELTNPQAVCL